EPTISIVDIVYDLGDLIIVELRISEVERVHLSPYSKDLKAGTSLDILPRLPALIQLQILQFALIQLVVFPLSPAISRIWKIGKARVGPGISLSGLRLLISGEPIISGGVIPC